MNSASDDANPRRRIRAPREHGEALIFPPLEQAGALLQQARQLAAGRRIDILGQSLEPLAAEARAELLRGAVAYTRAYRDVDPHTLAVAARPASAVLLAGHQPRLFHAGVWFKNFVLAELAVQLDAAPVNLIIDNDIVGAPSMRAPSGDADELGAQVVLFDRPPGESPFEERGIEDQALFDSFPQRIGKTLGGLIRDPLLNDYWPHVQSAAAQTGNLGRSLAQGRHVLEGDWGVSTLELPLSSICQSRAFTFFTGFLLDEAPRVGQAYNAALAEHRAEHRIRSRSHPAPDLAVDNEWREVPLWIWSTRDPRRRRVFARRRGDELELTDRAELRRTLPAPGEGGAEKTVEALFALAAEGIKLRPRALITTMFARLFLGDLFLHGVGGAKYDELTDKIMRRLWDIEPPPYMTISATMRLPLVGRRADSADVRALDEQLRRLRFQPERLLATSDMQNEAALAFAREKQRWIDTPAPRGGGQERRRMITLCNEKMQPHVEPLRLQLQQTRAQTAAAARNARLLNSREFSFCLFPEITLRDLLLELSRREP